MMSALGDEMRPADQAEPRLDQAWLEKHNHLTRLVSEASHGPRLDIYFLGDSITEWWPVMAPELWETEFGKWRVVNCGASGDTTQNILYRITHGEFEQISPKVIVVLAGINNLASSTQLEPEDLAAALGALFQLFGTNRQRAKSCSSRFFRPLADRIQFESGSSKQTNDWLT